MGERLFAPTIDVNKFKYLKIKKRLNGLKIVCMGVLHTPHFIIVESRRMGNS